MSLARREFFFLIFYDGVINMGYFFLLLTTAILFIRPAEINYQMFGYYFYETFIVSCIACSFQHIVKQFNSQDMNKTPINSCILWFFVAIVISHLGNGQVSDAIEYGTEFIKLLLYFYLFVGLIDSPQRLISYIRWITIFSALGILIAFLHMYRYIEIDQANVFTTVDGVDIERMGGTGLFKDPNDLSLLAGTFIPICAFMAVKQKTPFVVRLFWGGLIVFFFRAIIETASRGGLVALGGGIIGFAFARFGRKGLFLLPLLPALLLLVGGRQGNVSLSGGTGQGRIQIQHEAMVAFIRIPVFGMGSNHSQNLSGHVCHNSFVQGYLETGAFGGACFVAAYYCAIMILIKISKGRKIIDPDMQTLRPFLISVIAVQIAGKMSLSQNYIIPTFLFLGLATAFTRVTVTEPPVEQWFKSPLFLIIAEVGVVSLIAIFIYVNVMVRFG